MFWRRIEPSRIEFPRVDTATLADSAQRQTLLARLYTYVESLADGQSAWYKKKRVIRQVVSLWIRFCSLLFLFLGGLCPLLPKDFLGSTVEFGPWGYFLIGVGGGLLLFDRLFGISSSWMRFIWTHFVIEALRDEFRMLWMKTLAEAADANSAETFRTLVAAAEDAIKRIHAAVLFETSAWRAEFESNIASQMNIWKSHGEGQGPSARARSRSKRMP